MTSELPASPGGLRQRLINIGACLLLIGAAAAGYHNGLDGPFLPDDYGSIHENPNVRRVWPIWVAARAPTNTSVAGRPIPAISLALNHAIDRKLSGNSEPSPRGYHIFNLLIHALTACVLFGLLRRTFLLPRLFERFGHVATALAFTIALVWTVHPLQTECIHYVVVRTELLMGLFYLTTLYCFIRGASSPRPGPWYAGAVAACAAGMASKEVMVTAPIVVWLFDRTFTRDLGEKTFLGSDNVVRKRWPLYAALAATWLILAGLMAGGPRSGSAGFGVEGVSAVDYLRTQAGAILHYLKLAIWPRPLVLDYHDWPIARSWGPALVPGAVIALLLVITAAGLARRWPSAFVGACFFLVLAPTSSIVPIVTEVVSERRMYLPLAAAATLVFGGAYTGMRRLAGRVEPARLIVIAAGLLISLGLGHLTVSRNRDYRDALTIWQDTVAKRPGNARAYSNLGIALLERGRGPEGIERLQKAVALDPTDDIAHVNLGQALSAAGQTDAAVQEYLTAIQLNPNRHGPHFNLGVIALRRGQLADAEKFLGEAFRIRPWDAGVRVGLGEVLLQTGYAAEAERHFRYAVAIDPRNARAYGGLAGALLKLGRTDEAIECGQIAIELDPRAAGARYNLAYALLRRGRIAESVKYLRETLAIDPDWPPPNQLLAWILATVDDTGLRNPSEALKLAEHAARLTNERDPLIVATVAAAQAGLNQYTRAAETARRAAELARLAGNPALAAQFESHAERYRTLLAWRLSTYSE